MFKRIRYLATCAALVAVTVALAIWGLDGGMSAPLLLAVCTLWGAGESLKNAILGG